MKRLAFGVAVLICASCTSTREGENGSIFASPGKYLGDEVDVCGYLSGASNILETLDGGGAGLSILSDEKLADGVRRLSQRQRICLAGTIEHVGCGDASVICTDWAYEYGVRVRRIH